MDLSTLPDLVQHFAIAVQFAPDFVQHGIEPARNFFAAFGHDSPMTGAEKMYHVGKFCALGALLAVTIAEGNIEGIMGTGFAEADEIYDLCCKGAQARHISPP